MRAIDLRASLAVNERDIARGMTAEEREEERTLATSVATWSRASPGRRASRSPMRRGSRRCSNRSTRRPPGGARGWSASTNGCRTLRPGAVSSAADGDRHAALVPEAGSLLLSFVLDEEELLVLAVRRPPAAPDAEAAAAEPVYEALRRAGEEAAACRRLPPRCSRPRLPTRPAWRKTASALTALLPAAGHEPPRRRLECGDRPARRAVADPLRRAALRRRLSGRSRASRGGRLGSPC